MKRIYKKLLTPIMNLPFGTALVAIGQGGLPDDVKPIPLSALARQSGMT
ncbi:hypothetical protein ACFLV0_04875 [Chloroflexota bacterium]